MATPLVLHKVSIDGPFNVIADLDQNWSDIENYATALGLSIESLGQVFTDYINEGERNYFAHDTKIVSGASSYDYVFPDLSTWDELEIHYTFVGSTAQQISALTSEDGGSTWFDGSTDYRVHVSTTWTFANSIQMSDTNSTQLRGTITIRKLHSGASDMTFIISTIHGVSGSGMSTRTQVRAMRNSANNQNAIRFLASAGTFNATLAIFRRKFKEP